MSNGNLCLITSSINAIRLCVGAKKTQHGVVVMAGVKGIGVDKGGGGWRWGRGEGELLNKMRKFASSILSRPSRVEPSAQEVECLLGTSCPFRWSRAPI